MLDWREVAGTNPHRRTFLQLMLAGCALPVAAVARQNAPAPGAEPIAVKGDGFHVYPKGRIQDALEAAAKDPTRKTVFVHAGTYRPAAPGQALIWFNARHDGITLEAVGDVIADRRQPGRRRRRRRPAIPPS